MKVAQISSEEEEEHVTEERQQLRHAVEGINFVCCVLKISILIYSPI